MTADALHPWQIAVCPTTGWAEPIIEWATRGRMTHSYLVLADCTYSMEPGGLIERPLGYWGENSAYSAFEYAPRTEHLRKSIILDFLAEHDDAKYDYLGDEIVGLDDVTPPFLDPFWHWVEKLEDKARPNAWYCSAFTDAAMTHAGFTVIDDGRPFHSVTPMDLYREFVKRGWVK